MAGFKVNAGGGKSVERIGEGTFMARVVSLVTLGEHQYHSKYPEKGDCDKLLITVELPSETVDVDGVDVPRLLSKTENVFLNEKSNLYKIVQACDPSTDISNGYDLSGLIGKECMVTIGTTSGGKDKITQWAGIMKGLTVPEQVAKSVLFDFYSPDQEIFNDMMDWVKEELQSANNFSGSELEKMVTGDTSTPDAEEDLPF